MQSEYFNFPMPAAEDTADIEVVSDAISQIDAEIYKISQLEKYGGNIVYTINIENRGSGNNILWVDIDNVTSYDDLDGKIIAIYTGIYCCQWDTPQTVYVNVNGLGARAIRRPLPTNGSADYDTTKQYYTDKYVKGEISRYQTLLLGFSGTTVTLLNPAPAPRATADITEDTTDDVSYVTPKLLADFVNVMESREIDGDRISDGSITTAKIADGAVTVDKLSIASQAKLDNYGNNIDLLYALLLGGTATVKVESSGSVLKFKDLIEYNEYTYSTSDVNGINIATIDGVTLRIDLDDVTINHREFLNSIGADINPLVIRNFPYDVRTGYPVAVILGFDLKTKEYAITMEFNYTENVVTSDRTTINIVLGTYDVDINVSKKTIVVYKPYSSDVDDSVVIDTTGTEV